MRVRSIPLLLLSSALFLATTGACTHDTTDAGPAPIADPEPEPEPPAADPKADGFGALVDIAGHPSEAEIQALYDQGIVAGFPGGYFHPDAGLTRAQYAAMVERAFLQGQPLSARAWPDLSRDHWAHDFVARAGATGFLRGADDGTVRPDAAMTRQQLYVGIVNGLRSLDVPLPETDTDYLARFVDGDQLADWAKEGSASAHFYGMLDAPLVAGDLLQPNRPITRAEAVTVLYRARQLRLRTALGVYAGEPSFGDFAEGVVVAGPPVTDPEVVLACTRGTIYVAGGAAAGAVAAMLTSAGDVGDDLYGC